VPEERAGRRATVVTAVATRGDGTSAEICERCVLADRPLLRLRGLLGRRGLEPGEGLLLRPSNSIHMLFMRFAIDAVFLDAGDVVIDVVARLRPWRIALRRGAKAVLEIGAGEAARVGLSPGDRLAFVQDTADADA
jgi:uncharacterized membrane protein (UPF0127 family)